jgi:signal transduction histidine kinase
MGPTADSPSTRGSRATAGTGQGRIALRPRPLGIAFTIIVIGLMLSLGGFIVAKYRGLQLHSYGEIGRLYIDHLLAPYSLSRLNPDADGGAPQLQPPEAWDDAPAGDVPIALRIWLLDGTLLYTSIPTDKAEGHDAADLHRAIRGERVETLQSEGGPGDPGFPVRYPFFEVYAPIHDPRSGEIIAVGEVYQDASEILRDRSVVEVTVWAVIGLVTLGVLAMMAISARQGEQLETLLRSEQGLGAQNELLRREAEQARREAVRTNEQVLNLVGAELHDGPVQLLGLASLMQSRSGDTALPDGTLLRDLLTTVHAQLRTIAAGLILPEVEHLNPAAVVDLAVVRHRALSGTPVDLANGLSGVDLDPPRKVCIYRVVQEGLTNAARHGDGNIPSLAAVSEEGSILVTIRSVSGAGAAADSDAKPGGLGLQGMRRRLEAFGGNLTLENSGGWVTLQARLPLA